MFQNKEPGNELYFYEVLSFVGKDLSPYDLKVPLDVRCLGSDTLCSKIRVLCF